MKFFPEKPPFPLWTGPYSPARGTTSGFRIKNGQLGAWIFSDEGQSFCHVQKSEDISNLSKIVTSHWRGGRILFLPNGIVVKPLQDNDEQCNRVVIGRFQGGFSLGPINLVPSQSFIPGHSWPGPNTIGLECTINRDGTLSTRWRQSTDYGYDEYSQTITNSNQVLALGFRKARPYDTGGRVRVTVGGHVFTNKKVKDGYHPIYVGKIDTTQFSNWDTWIQRS